MSDTASAAATREEARTADLILPSPRESPDPTTSSGDLWAVEAEGDSTGIAYPAVRYALGCLRSRNLL